MHTKLLQLYYDLRHQPVVTWITLVGTSLSLFLIMVVVMMQQVSLIPYTPESCRPRLLLGAYMHITDNTGGDSSAGMNYDTAKKLYDGLDGVERISFITQSTSVGNVKGSTNEAFEVGLRKCDSEFFNIFDHTLLQGRYYTKDESDSQRRVAVLTESVARRLFGNEHIIGNTFLLNHEPYTVVGIVKNHSKLALTGSGDLFIPTGPNDPTTRYGGDLDYFGNIAVAILVKEGVDFDYIRNQVKARYAELDTELSPSGGKTVYHESPFDQETIASGLSGSNTTPSPEAKRKERYIIYGLLLLVPAINLSTMLHSRLRRRISEIGVRRAFGCTRARIITDILAENFIITLIGGIIGLLLSVIFAMSYNGLFDSVDNFNVTTPTLSVLLNWRIILGALTACFLLNIISAALPAWQASRLNPVNAINA